jgi:hypothetical protein
MKDHLINRLSMLILVLSLIFIVACNYYKPIPTSPSLSSSAKTKEIASQSQRTFIVRSNQGDFLLKNVNVRLDKEDMTGILESVPEYHQTYIKDEKLRYSYDSKTKPVLQELHIYAPLDPASKIGSTVTIPISSIARMEIIERDKKRSTTNTIILATGVTLGALAVAAIITSASVANDVSKIPIPTPKPIEPEGMSCPFISAYDGEDFIFQGEAFGGALFHSVARQDYLPLPSMSFGPELQLMISNERKEHMYIDVADLLLVEHSAGDKVLVDPNGNLMRAHAMGTPKEAIMNGQKEMLNRISELDNVFCSFNDIDQSSSINELIVKFDHPGEGKELGLYLNLRDSPWLEYIFEKFMSKYGDQFQAFDKEMDTKSAEELYLWQEIHQVPLTISVKTTKGWKEVTKTRFVGPVMNREIAISLEGIELKEPIIEVSFKTGFLYWEIDQIALATVSRISTESIRVLKPSVAIDEKGKDKLRLISELDDQFLEQPVRGNKAYLTYQFKEFSGYKAYSAFLQTGGYYKVHHEFEGPMDQQFFSKYDKPGGLSDFSMRSYLEVSQYTSSPAN